MSIEKILIKQSIDAAENQDIITTNASLGVAMAYNEGISKIMEDYYNKASGCSVKSQKVNSFGYGSLSQV